MRLANITKFIPSILILIMALSSTEMVGGTLWYKSIHTYLPSFSGWGFLIALGYFILNVKHKEGVLAEVSSGMLVLECLFETVGRHFGWLSWSAIFYFQIVAMTFIILIVAACFYLKRFNKYDIL